MRRPLIISLLLATSISAHCGKVKETSFSVTNPLDGTVLNGTLSTPEKDVPKAVVVLATGSGLQDRDETIGRHKPFRDIADYLASNGYAVARTDDRGYGNPVDTVLLKTSTQWDELGDYRNVMKEMKTLYPDIPVGMLGHSLGGSEAIMSFSQTPKASKYNSSGMTPEFIITLAAPTVAGDSLILDQTRQLLRLQGAEFAFDQMKPTLSQRYTWAKSFMPETALRNTLMEDIKSTLPPGMPISPDMQKTIDSQIDVFVSPAYRELLRYDPTEDIKNINVPWLALYGTKDVQVSASCNAPALEKAAEGKSNITITTLEDKNHLFQNAKTGAIEEYDAINSSIADDVLQEILEWLEMNFNNN